MPHLDTLGSPIAGPKQNAFSLVEVVIALGVAVFALLAIVSLLPAGMQLVRESDEETRAVNLLSKIVADRRATPSTNSSAIYALPALTNTILVTNTIYLREGGELTTDANLARYRVNYALYPATTGRATPPLLWLCVGWPAKGSNSMGTLELTTTFPSL